MICFPDMVTFWNSSPLQFYWLCFPSNLQQIEKPIVLSDLQQRHVIMNSGDFSMYILVGNNNKKLVELVESHYTTQH